MCELADLAECIVDDVAKDALDPAIFGPRASELDAERKKIKAGPARDRGAHVVTLHLGALKRYEEVVGRLQQSVEAGISEGNREYAEALCNLVGR